MPLIIGNLPIGSTSFGGGAGSVVPTDQPPEVPSYEIAQTSYGLSSANHLESIDQNGIRLPAGSSALPAVDADWFDWLFFSVDEMLQHAVAGFAIASKGNSGHALSGGNQTGVNVRGGLVSGSLDPFTVGFAASNSANRSFFPDMVRSPAIERGAAHLVVFGQKGRVPFWALVRINLDGKTDPVIVVSQVGAPNDGADGWRYTSAGAARWTAGNYELLSGFGGNVDVADGANRRGAGGAIGQFVSIWGSFPFVNGAPDPDMLKAIANGTVDPFALATSISGTLRYANHMRGPGDLAADPRGVITAAATELAGLNTNCKPYAAAPMRRPPQLRLRSYGDGFVFPMGANKAGSVPFRGSFTGTAMADSFEARLVRVDSGVVLVDWTTLDSTIDATAKTFTASLAGVPAGIAFRREIRWRRRPAISYRDADRVALGIVIVDIGQSQLAYQGYASNTGDAGSGANLAPSSDDNRFLSVIKQAFPINAQGQSTPFWSAALFKPYKAGQHGDGNIATFEQIKRTLGVPIMVVDTATPGTHPNRWLSDRQTFAYSGFGTFTPDGTTTAFGTFTPVSSALRQDSDNNAPASCVPGTFQMTVGSVSITDDGNGNLVGSGITAGTINYQTGAIASLTFSTAPAAGAAVSGSFKFFAVAPENGVLPQAGAMSMFGDTTQPLDSTYKRGRVMLHLTRMRHIAPSIYRVFWYTAFASATQTQISSMFDRLRTKLDLVFSAGAATIMGVILPGRENAGAEGSGARLVNANHRAALTGKTGFQILGDALDFEIFNNSGPHQDPALSRSFSERLGAAIAALHVSDWNANGPIVSAARFTDANRTAIDVTFTLPAGTAITTADASTTGIQGFAVAPSGTSETAWDRTGFTAEITGPTTARLTKSSGSWATGQRIAYANGTPVSTGQSATKAADNASLLKMISDNENTYAGQAKFTVRAGNVARVIQGMTIAESSVALNNLFQTASDRSYNVYTDESDGGRLFRVARRTPGSTLSMTSTDNKLRLTDDGTNAYVCRASAGTIAVGDVLDIAITETHPNATGPRTSTAKVNGIAKGNWVAALAAGYRVATMAGQVNNASYTYGVTLGGTRNRFITKKPAKLGRGSQKSLRIGYSTMRLAPTTSQEELSGPALDILAVAVEIPGAPTPVVVATYGGQKGFTIPAGRDLEFLDEITPAMFGLTEFEDSDEPLVTTVGVIPTTGTLYTPGQTIGQSFLYDSAVVTTDPETLAKQQGTIGQPSGGAALFMPSFVMVVGLPVNGKTQVPSMFIAGDSITDRLSDGGGDGRDGGGYAKRAAFAAGIPYFSHSLGGRQVGHWAGNHYMSRAFAKFCTFTYCGWPTNDVNGGRTSTAILADLSDFYAEMKSYSHTSVIQGTMPPRISSGTKNNNGDNILSNWRATDLEHQIPFVTSAADGKGYELGGVKDTVNTAIRDLIGKTNGADILCDVASLASDNASGISKWKLRTFSAALTTAHTAGTTTFVMDQKPDIDECFVIEPGTSNVEPIGTKTGPFRVISVTGSGPYTVTFGGESTTLDHPVGSVIKATNSADETHPNTPFHKDVDTTILRPILFGFLPAYTFQNAEASSYVARMTSPPSDKRRGLLDKLFGDLKTAGVLSILDELHVVATHSQQAANENLISTSYTLTSTAFPTWTKDRGYKGNASNQFAATGFNPSTATGAKHVQDSAHIGVFTLVDGTTGEDFGSQNGRSNVHSRAAGHGGRVSQSTGGLGGSGSTASPHHVVANRTASNASELLVDGAQFATLATASTSLASGLDILRNNNGYGDARVAIVHTGGALTTTAQKTGLYNALKAYLQGIGAVSS